MGHYNRRPSRPDTPIGGNVGGRGIAAPHANECHRCGDDMENTRDMVKVKGRWIHRRCASGADDE